MSAKGFDPVVQILNREEQDIILGGICHGSIACMVSGRMEHVCGFAKSNNRLSGIRVFLAALEPVQRDGLGARDFHPEKSGRVLLLASAQG